MYKLIKIPDSDNHFDHVSIQMQSDTVSLPDLVEMFEDFLKGAGFSFDGHLDFVEEETP